VARLVERAIRTLPEAERTAGGVSLARDLIDRICARLDLTDWTAQRPVLDGHVLEAVTGRRPDGRAAAMPRPLTPLLDTCLMTNATGEPRIGAQIASEIPSAHRIDLVMAFIRWTGVRDLLEPLRTHCAAGRPLRVLTTTYTASTEPRALEALRALGAQIRVSYDTSGTRLHAKAWLFHRDTGVSTAYIGSSNLTMSAQTTGLEWNLRRRAAQYSRGGRAHLEAARRCARARALGAIRRGSVRVPRRDGDFARRGLHRGGRSHVVRSSTGGGSALPRGRATG